MSAPQQDGVERCASCGEPATTQLVTELDNAPLCEGCSGRLLAGEAVAYFVPTEEEPSPPPDERFADLFKAARVLLRDGKAEEPVQPLPQPASCSISASWCSHHSRS